MNSSSFSNIVLTGFSGSGKSTIGPKLAMRLKAEFFDTDAMIEKQTGRTIADLIDCEGETYFRRLEHETLKRILSGRGGRKLIALGGGAFIRRENRKLIDKDTVVVYLSCPVRELYRRLKQKNDRPLLEVKPKDNETIRLARLRKIRELFEQRRKSYEMADLRISTADKSVATCVEQIITKLRKRNVVNPG